MPTISSTAQTIPRHRVVFGGTGPNATIEVEDRLLASTDVIESAGLGQLLLYLCEKGITRIEVEVTGRGRSQFERLERWGALTVSGYYRGDPEHFIQDPVTGQVIEADRPPAPAADGDTSNPGPLTVTDLLAEARSLISAASDGDPVEKALALVRIADIATQVAP